MNATQQQAKLQLEVGKWYRTRHGKKMECVRVGPYCIFQGGGYGLHTNRDGEVYLGMPDDWDIVAEWQDDEVVLTGKTITAGDSVRITMPYGWSIPHVPHTPTCNHEYVNMSAFHIRMVCKHCDKDKP